MENERQDPVDRAEQLFVSGYACSQAVVMAFAPRLGIDVELAARAASAFGGGMARHGWTCGALTGAIIAIGLHAGNALADDLAAKEDAYARVRALAERFAREHGSTVCRTLTGFDIGDEAERKAATEAGVFRTICPRLVRTCAALVNETLAVPRGADPQSSRDTPCR